MIRRLCSVAACAATCLAFSALAQESLEEYDLNLAAMTLSEVVIQLSQQTGLSVLYVPQSKKDEARIVGPLQGRYRIEVALRILLAPHGLAFERADERVLVVRDPTPALGRAEAPERLAEGEGEKPHAIVKRAPEAQTVSISESGTAAHRPYEGLEEVIVTGTRLTRTGESPAPVQVLSRAKLAQLGVSTLAEVMLYVPQQPYAYSESHRINGQYAEIRGLGADGTLVLINGRRVPPSAASVVVNAFDLNTIPLAAVERVEVLAASAAAVYGADAMGGVVNVILKKEIADPVIDVRYGAAAGGAEERRASLSAGHSGDRLTGSLVLDYFERNALLGAERERWRDQDFRRFGAPDRRSVNANPGNISPLMSGLAPSAAAQNLESLLRFWSAVPETDRASAAAYGELHLGARVSGFGELLYTNRAAEFQVEPSAIAGAVAPATNPFNPFGAPVVVNYLLTDLGPRRVRGEAELLRAVAGARGEWDRWSWEASALVSDESASLTSSNWVHPGRLAAALSSSDPSQALNVFGDGPAGSRALLRSLIASPMVSDFAATSMQGAGFVRGPLLRLPSGEVSAVAGAEWREDELRGAGLPARNRTVSGMFSELHVPLAPVNALPALKELSLTLAARIDRYADFGDRLNPQYGLVWRPHGDLAVRASYGESYRPPSLYELHAPRLQTPAQFQDARRNGETASFSVITGGNPDLEPTEGDSLTAGLVYAPVGRDSFRSAITYWRTRVDNRVALLSVARALAAENELADRVLRAAPNPADAAAGLPGVLLAIDASYGNYGKVETSGIDMEASYAFETSFGTLTPRIVAVWTGEFESIDQPGGRVRDRVGVASPLGTIPRWRGVASVEWSGGPWRTSATARYTHRYEDANGFATTGRTVAAQTFLDLQGALELGEFVAAHELSGITLTVGVQNVFDEAPRFSEVNTVTGFDLSQGDLRQRFFYLNLSKEF
jgi:iron complex outermembrane recepter protein